MKKSVGGFIPHIAYVIVLSTILLISLCFDLSSSSLILAIAPTCIPSKVKSDDIDADPYISSAFNPPGAVSMRGENASLDPIEVIIHVIKMGKLGSVMIAMSRTGEIIGWIPMSDDIPVAETLFQLIDLVPPGSTVVLSIPLSRVKSHLNLITACGRLNGGKQDIKLAPFSNTIKELKSLS